MMQTQVVVHETQEDLEAWINKYSKRQADQSPEQYGEHDGIDEHEAFSMHDSLKLQNARVSPAAAAASSTPLRKRGPICATLTWVVNFL